MWYCLCIFEFVFSIVICFDEKKNELIDYHKQPVVGKDIKNYIYASISFDLCNFSKRYWQVIGNHSQQVVEKHIKNIDMRQFF